MKEVSYCKFKTLEKLLSLHLAYKDSPLWKLVSWLFPKEWNDIYKFPYYYRATEKHCPNELKEKFPLIGNRVQVNTLNLDGILKGFAVTVEDYYYLIEDEYGNERWDTCVDSITVL